MVLEKILYISEYSVFITVLMSKLRNTNESVSMELLTVRFQVT